MTQREKLLQRARENPKTLTFDELLRIAAWHGFSETGGKGSHRVYTHPDLPGQLLTFYDSEWARAKQVRALLEAIDELPPAEGR